MLPILQVGPLSFRTPGLVLLAGVWLSLEVASRFGRRRGIDVDRAYSLGFYVLIAGVAAARLAFVLTHLNLYTRITPWTRALGAVASVSPGTEIAWVGLLAAAAVAALLVWRWRLPPLKLADAFAPALAVLTFSIGLAALLSGDLLGTPTGLPWGIPLSGASRQPTQILLMLAALGALAAVWRLEKPSRFELPPGTLAQIVVGVLSVAILLIDPLRADSAVIGPGLRLLSVVALVVLVVDLALFAVRAPAREPAPHRDAS